MGNILQLRRAIGREEFDHTLLASALSGYKAIDQKISRLIDAGEILQVKRGLYVFGEDVRQMPLCREALANVIYGPSCISLEYALSFHGLIPERVETITSVTPKPREKVYETPVGRFTYKHLNIKKFPHGLQLVPIDKQHTIFIASPEKALCDYLLLKKVKVFQTNQAARDFLQDDLRVDKDQWHRFDIKTLIALNRHYKLPNVTRIVEIL